MYCLVNVTSNKLVDVIINNFSGDEIKESKRLLCNTFDENFNDRKTTTKRSEKEAHDSIDIVETLNQLETSDKINMNNFAIDSAGLLNMPEVNLEVYAKA